MFVDDHLVLEYLSNDRADDIKNHWIFDSIEKGKHLFEAPNIEKRADANRVLMSVKERLADFRPLNESIFSALYPGWRTLLKELSVLLVVGCPEPYDAMIRDYDGKQYIIFDLIRFNAYLELGHDIELLIRRMITHEASHLCLQKEHPYPVSNGFTDLLKHITFDEAFAHLLAFKEDVREFDFSAIISEHYAGSLLRLKEALKETDTRNQEGLLIQANSGSYWDKFAAISGKLFLASHLDDVQNLYTGGVVSFVSRMGLTG